MKKLLAFTMCCLVLPAFTAQAKRAAKPEQVETPVLTDASLSNAADSAAYAMGILMANEIKPLVEQRNMRMDEFAFGFNSVLFGRNLKMTQAEADTCFKNYTQKLRKTMYDKQKAEQAAFLAENKKREGVVETASGLQYQVVTQGQGAKPGPGDRVKVHYQGFLLDGTKFDSSIDRGEPIVFGVNQVIAGWQEGLQLMNVGSKYTLYIPYELGYGVQGAGGVIPPCATLIFEVELLGIE